MPLYVPVRGAAPSPGQPAPVEGLTGLLAPGVDGEPADLRGELIEGVIEESEDETLMERYVGGEEIDEAVLTADLERAVARATFFPVVPVCSVTGMGCTELLDLAVRAFPSPAEHPAPDVFKPSGAAAGDDHLRPGRAARRRDRQDHERPVRRSAEPGARLLRHARARPGGARVRPPDRLLRRGRRTPGPRRGRADRCARLLVRQGPGAGLADRGRRPGRDRAAHPRGDRRHAVRRRRAPRAAAVVVAGAAAPDRDRRAQQGRRRQAVAGPAPGSARRTRRCGSTTTPRPTSWCCGAWASHTPTSSSSG